MSSEYALGSVEVALKPMERFEEYLQSRGKRITRPRRVLLDHVFSRHEHFDADELMEELAKIPDLSRADRPSRPTVYRTLTELVSAGLLRKMELGGRAVYEHDYGYPQHDHLHCPQCNKLIEFQSEELNRLRDDVAREHKFRATGHKFIITGICEECNRQRVRPLKRMDRI